MSSKSSRILLTALTSAAVAAIWIHSMMPAAISSGESVHVLGILQQLLKLLHLPDWLTEPIVRKSAHFIEYLVLGFLLKLTFSAWQKKAGTGLMCLIFMIPFLDETIQLFVPGRSGQVSDVWLDIAGEVTGLLLGLAAQKLVSFVKNKQSC